MMGKLGKTSLLTFVILLSLTMVGEGMITVTLLWTSASAGQSPMFIGVVLFIMNIVPFLAQFVFKPLRYWIELYPIRMIILPRVIGAAIAVGAGLMSDSPNFAALIAVAACLTFITFISQQCVETLMGQLTVSGILDAATSARLSQTALQSGVFIGNALAGVLIAKAGTGSVYFAIAISFATSLLLFYVAPSVESIKNHRDTPRNRAAVQKRTIDVTLWILLIGMALLAVQLSGFNFFVPLVFEERAGVSAADYGLVSAAAGVGALLATFVRFSTREYLGYIACLAVVVGDVIVTHSYGTIITLLFAFLIGFGFNLSRIQLRQAIFQRLTTHQESALWGARVTVAFRGVSAGAPLLFGLLLADGTGYAANWIFAAIGLIIMGAIVPFCLLYAKKVRPVIMPA